MTSSSPTYFPLAPTPRCCSTGHPVLADPLTGRTVCSCQLQSGVPAYLSRVPSLPEHQTPKFSAGNIVNEQKTSAFYSTHSLEKHRSSLSMHTPVMHPHYLEHASTHPYGAFYPFDINGARRKATNREATGPLKAWLYQHRKNPYPTKGEKVMLAIISQMTLTQVSTWFANARRRLKKEAKVDGKGLDLSDIDANETSPQNDSLCSRFSDSDSESAVKISVSDISDISDNEEQVACDRSGEKTCTQRLFSPDGRTEVYLERHISPRNISPSPLNVTETTCVNSANKNKDDILSSSDKVNSDEINNSNIDISNSKQDAKSSERPQNKSKIWSIAQMLG